MIHPRKSVVNRRSLGHSRSPLAVFLCATVVLSMEVGFPGDGLSATRTKVRLVHPFNKEGHLKAYYHVKRTWWGHCWTGSIGSQQRNAWRCLHHNLILDPCFKHKGTPKLACLRTPWSHAVTRLRLTRRLPRHERNDGVHHLSVPWGYRLLNGTKCVLSQGTSPQVHGVALPYLCSGGRWGSTMRRHHPRWRAKIAPPNLSRLSTHKVGKAWF